MLKLKYIPAIYEKIDDENQIQYKYQLKVSYGLYIIKLW